MKMKKAVWMAVFGIVTFLGAGTGFGGVTAGQQAREFSLRNTQGKVFELTQMKNQPLTVLYFFDAESRPSQEGLLSLDNLMKKYQDIDMAVWGVTLSAEKQVTDVVSRVKPQFPVLLDDAGVSDLYEARKLLPTVYILGPELKILNVIPGGGKTVEIMLARLAETSLQRQKTDIAKQIGADLEKRDPENLDAIMVQAYAALKEGNLGEAESKFDKASHQKGLGEVLGQEGNAMVAAQKGEWQKALSLAAEVEANAPERSFAHVVKGKVLYAQNKKTEAEAEYRKAVKKTEALSLQKTMALTQLGQVNAEQKNFAEARKAYDQALDINPYDVEVTTNKGLTYEKEGRWGEALGTYKKALEIEQHDAFAVVLAKKAQEMIDLQKDTERKKRIDTLVKELADRYRTQQATIAVEQDEWTSRPMVMTFLDFQEKGGLPERDGIVTVLTSQLADDLNASGRVRVVERVILDQLLAELNLGSSEIADRDTALKLGRVLAAKLIGTGALFFLPEATHMSFRLVDTETTGISGVLNRKFESLTVLDQEVFSLNREILRTVIEKYPLQGFVVQASGNRVMLNIGEQQGVVTGTTFEVLEDPEPVMYRGRALLGEARTIGQLEVVKVEPDLCYANVVQQGRPFRMDDKVREKIADTLKASKYGAAE